MPEENGTVIPHTHLTPKALRGLAEEFVTRDGTDYGRVERTLDEKVAAVMRQLDRGEAVIVYDSVSDSASIVPKGSATMAGDTEAPMGDKSPKSKVRGQKQKNAARAEDAAAAKAKQSGQSHAPRLPGAPRK